MLLRIDCMSGLDWLDMGLFEVVGLIWIVRAYGTNQPPPNTPNFEKYLIRFD